MAVTPVTTLAGRPVPHPGVTVTVDAPELDAAGIRRRGLGIVPGQ